MSCTLRHLRFNPHYKLPWDYSMHGSGWCSVVKSTLKAESSEPHGRIALLGQSEAHLMKHT
jgi:hypothetical protein